MRNQVSSYNPFGLVDPFFDDFFTSERKSNNQVMRTDIKDNGDHYELKIELPEVKKEDVHLSLDNGTLTVEAKTESSNDEKKHGHYIRKERYYGTFERSFYVGDNIKQEDINAKLLNGVLTLTIKKVVNEEPKKTYISIE